MAADARELAGAVPDGVLAVLIDHEQAGLRVERLRAFAPPAVNSPEVMMLRFLALADVVMIWKRSVPERAGLAFAAARPDLIHRVGEEQLGQHQGKP